MLFSVIFGENFLNLLVLYTKKISRLFYSMFMLETNSQPF